MAFDGITIANVVKEMNDTIIGCRIYKIAQPEADELLLTIKGSCGQKRLFISAGASLPLIYFTENNKPSPMTAPGFCMLLRKHLQNGRIVSVTQPGLERIIHMDIEHLDEMGDLCRKRLIIEIMGKHSNIIFCHENGTIIDSIKHVSGLVSSVREVLPGKQYFVADTQDKADALNTNYEEFVQLVLAKPTAVFKAIYGSYTGISPILAQEICFRAGVDGDAPCASLSDAQGKQLFDTFINVMVLVKNGEFAPHIAYTGKQPVEFAAIPLTMYSHGDDYIVPYESMSLLLEQYYAEKNTLTRICQKSED